MESLHQHHHEKFKLVEINSYLTCFLCKGYLIDAATISECLHSFCRSCIIKFLQDNSYCPVCEVLVNKAKPNLKLDKTLQDVVYKLVPGLFVKEMIRRKLFYQKNPEEALKVSPELRGEDTERTIFNPQDEISLSIEYISDDSTPGAISVPNTKPSVKSVKNTTTSEQQDSQIKRYLQCPGMCRVDVLKKFVRNKYNVDTSSFYIDVLYKRVPLPDHYTLIDIAYIYSWKRNEPMKFYFRITDINKVTERFDFFDARNPTPEIFLTPIKLRNNGDREKKPVKKTTAKTPHIGVNKLKRTSQIKNSDLKKIISDSKKLTKSSSNLNNKNCETSVVIKTDVKVDENCAELERRNKENISGNDNKVVESLKAEDAKTQNSDVKKPVYMNITLNRTNNVEIITKIQEVPTQEGQNIVNIIEKTVKKGTPQVPVSTNVSKRENMIKKVPKLLIKKNKKTADLTINKKTTTKEIIRKLPKILNKKDTTDKQVIDAYTFTDSDGELPVHQPFTLPAIKKEVDSNLKEEVKMFPVPDSDKIITNIPQIPVIKQEKPEEIEDEKSKFLKSFQLKAKSSELTNPKVAVSNVQPQLTNTSILPVNSKVSVTQKRKNSSPIKNDKAAKKSKTPEKKNTVTKIILQSKNLSSAAVKEIIANATKNNSNAKIVEANISNGNKTTETDIKSIFDSCKINIPSSLSITLKEGNENSSPSSLSVPPVKNFIEILKLPEDDKEKDKKVVTEENEQDKVNTNDDDENHTKQPQIIQGTFVDLKQKFCLKQMENGQILPSPVPELQKVLNVPKEGLGKLNPRSPQTFQKIFEESIKKTDGKPTNENGSPSTGESNTTITEVTSTGGNKRNILEIASQLYKKTKLEMEKKNESVNSTFNAEEKLESLPNITTGRVAIPRLDSHQKTLKIPVKSAKFEVQTTQVPKQQNFSLHSNSLGLNYTVSVAQSNNNKLPQNKTNGILQPILTMADAKKLDANKLPVSKVETSNSNGKTKLILPKTSEPTNLTKPSSQTLSPVQIAPKPCISPMVKSTCFSPIAALKIQTTFPKSSSPKLQSPKPSSSSSSNASPKKSPGPKKSPQPKNSPSSSTHPISQLNSNQLLEQYNIQNLAQLTASFNFNPANFGLTGSNNQLTTALQQAMLLKHIEMQNRQNWLTMNHNHLMQYENYLKSLSQNHLLGNIKEN